MSITLESIDGFSNSQIKNIQKIIDLLPIKDVTDYSSGGGFWHILFLLEDDTAIEFHNEDGISMSKKKYLNVDEAYNDAEFQNIGWYPNVKIKPNFSNVNQIVKAIKAGDLLFSY